MNEPFVRKIYESGSDSVGSGIQDGLNFYGQQFKNLIESFPTVDAPIFLAAIAKSRSSAGSQLTISAISAVPRSVT